MVRIMGQRTKAWHEARRGRITCSKLGVIMTGTVKAKETYAKLLLDELMGFEIKTFTAKATNWGIESEPKALAAYQLKTGNRCSEAGFLVSPVKNYFGGSPDSLIDDNGGLEIKCPKDGSIHLDTFVYGMPEKHKPQVQGLMLVTGRKWWDFVSFDHRQPIGLDLYIERQHRDEEYLKEMDSRIIDFYYDFLDNIFMK